MSPSSSQPAGMQSENASVAPGNPIWLGGSGPEKGFIPGKRFMQRTAKESPFATSSDWNWQVLHSVFLKKYLLVIWLRGIIAQKLLVVLGTGINNQICQSN